MNVRKRILVILQLILILAAGICIPLSAQETHDSVQISPIVHAAVVFSYQGKTVYVDPIERIDFKKYPKADLILITHNHSDHFDKTAIKRLSKDNTLIIGPPTVISRVENGRILKNGESTDWEGIKIFAVPAYNIKGGDEYGLFHPKGRGNGYLIHFGEDRVYIAGDTELIPEIKDLAGKVDYAILPISKPYTMDEKGCAEAAKIIKPAYVIPYHFFRAKPELVKRYLDGTGIEVKIFKLK